MTPHVKELTTEQKEITLILSNECFRDRRKTTPREDRILFRRVKTNRRQTLKHVTARCNQRTGCSFSYLEQFAEDCSWKGTNVE
jgi:hypothetical protein